MFIRKNLSADLLQLCLSRGVTLLPSIYHAFLDTLDEMERKHAICLVPISRFELFHYKLKYERLSTKKTTPSKTASS